MDPDLAIFMVLTPFPGTDLYKTAHEKGWLEDYNWANYDMAHCVMPTEYLTVPEVQEELYNVIKTFTEACERRITGYIFQKHISKDKLTDTWLVKDCSST